MRDVFGVRAWRRRPLRDRLLPWQLYAVISAASLGCGLYLLSEPDGLGDTFVVAVLFLAMVPPLLYLTILSRRVHR